MTIVAQIYDLFRKENNTGMRIALSSVLGISLLSCSFIRSKENPLPDKMVRWAIVDERFQSFRYEPNKDDLNHPVLRKLVTSLGPMYLMVQGQKKWRGLEEFAGSVDARIINGINEDENIYAYESRIECSFPEEVLSESWLSRPAKEAEITVKNKNFSHPGSDVWKVKKTEAFCSSNEWGRSFLDSLISMDHLGRMAQKNIKVVFQNSLTGIHTGLIDKITYRPRPHYWASLLWKRLMSRTVLNPGSSSDRSLKLYAHCMLGASGGVALLVINLDKEISHHLLLDYSYTLYSLTSDHPMSDKMRLNGVELGVEDVSFGQVTGIKKEPGKVSFPPLSINFITMPDVSNQNCFFR